MQSMISGIMSPLHRSGVERHHRHLNLSADLATERPRPVLKAAGIASLGPIRLAMNPRLTQLTYRGISPLRMSTNRRGYHESLDGRSGRARESEGAANG